MHPLLAPLLLTAALSPTAEARKRPERPAVTDSSPAANAGEIPALAELLSKTGWKPTPELSGAFQAGHVFRETSMGHRLVTDTCISSQAREATYTETAMITSLQAGVSVGIGVGPGGGVQAGVSKKIKFGTPTQHTIPELELQATPDCATKLGRLDDLDGMYVVQEVLMATIAEQTCGSIDAQGRFISGLANVSAEVQQACSQASLEPVAVGYRTIPIASLVTAGPSTRGPGGPAPTIGDNCGEATVNARAAEIERRRAAARELDWTRLEGEYAALNPEGCNSKSDSTRSSCARELEAWIATVRGSITTVPGGKTELLTTCGPVKARFDKESVPTEYNLAVADAALSMLQRPSAKKLLSLGIENYKSGTPARVREGASQMEQACLGGEWVGCQWAGNRYRKGEGVSQNPTRAVELYTMGCDRDVYSACWELGLMLVDEDAGVQDMDRAWRVLDHACTGGHESSCAKTGRMLLNGEGTPADPGKGYARLEPLCTAGNGTACSHIAWGIRKGQGTAEDMRRALGYYEKGCDLEYAHACNEAGYLLDAGAGNVAEDNTRGTALYAKGCELGNAMACDNAGEQYKGGDGVSKSSSRAKTYFEKACSLGKQDSCKK